MLPLGDLSFLPVFLRPLIANFRHVISPIEELKAVLLSELNQGHFIWGGTLIEDFCCAIGAFLSLRHACISEQLRVVLRIQLRVSANVRSEIPDSSSSRRP